MYQKILINALGIQDSGGIRVLEKMLQECHLSNKYQFYIFLYEYSNVNNLIYTFSMSTIFNFIKIPNKGILNRLYIENFYFRRFIIVNNISMIYNFSGSNQYIMRIPSLVKVQNLMFYSLQLDKIYKKNYTKKLWLKDIWIKRIIFRSMLRRSHYLEIQSSHVQKELSNFIDMTSKKIYLKNDFLVEKNNFKQVKEYNFKEKITFLYIVGPHFFYPNKNMIDFVRAMSYLNAIGKDMEIKVTLSFEELNSNPLWDSKLNDKTIFLGYLKNKNEILKLFNHNTVLISTSVIETLGLHVIEGIQNGILCVTPDEAYSQSVYGVNLFKYKLFNNKSLINLIINLYNTQIDEIKVEIKRCQIYLHDNEAQKIQNIIEIFDEVLKKDKNVQK